MLCEVRQRPGLFVGPVHIARRAAAAAPISRRQRAHAVCDWPSLSITQCHTQWASSWGACYLGRWLTNINPAFPIQSAVCLSAGVDVGDAPARVLPWLSGAAMGLPVPEPIHREMSYSRNESNTTLRRACACTRLVDVRVAIQQHTAETNSTTTCAGIWQAQSAHLV